MDAGGEGFEDWDADFLDQVIRVEERALACSASASQHPPPNQPPNPSSPSSSGHLPTLPSMPQTVPRQSRLYAPSSSSSVAAPPLPPVISYSPPRELSQRHVDYCRPSSRQPHDGHASAAPAPPSADAFENLEYERLKKEFGRVCTQLASREQECAELRRKMEKKKEKIALAMSHPLTVSDDCILKDTTQVSREVNNVEVQESSQDNQESSCKAVGVQTENTTEATGLLQSNNRHTCKDLSVKLLSIWGLQFDQKVGAGLVSEILVIFNGLFRCIDADVSSKLKLDAVTDGTLNDLGCLRLPQSLSASDASKVTTFYIVLVKVIDGMAELEALLEPLVDLCGLDNVIILSRALCILHLILKHLSCLEQKPKSRDNIKIEGHLRGDDMAKVDGLDSAKPEFPLSVNFDETSTIPDTSIGFSPVAGSRLWNGWWSRGRILTSSSVDLLPLFELMHQIIKKNREENIRLEAVCIMNLILLRSSAYKEREKFCLQMVLESVSEMLKKECGSRLQKQALHLLFLLLNCPHILDKFCSNCKDQDHPWSVEIILHGMAGCIGSCGSAIDDLQLRRKAIILLAFLGSSGTAGFEILTSHQLPKGANFLMLMLQTLLSELDAEATASLESPEIPKERTLIMREGLILLNRLVSNSLYASTCLRVLTNSRDMVSLTIDVANRLSQKISRPMQVESTSRQTRESEVVDLAIAFKKRVYAYLGDMP